jgi:hypothetical protein
MAGALDSLSYRDMEDSRKKRGAQVRGGTAIEEVEVGYNRSIATPHGHGNGEHRFLGVILRCGG